MAGLIHDLTHILEEEYIYYKKIVELSKQKTNIIINGDVGELQKKTKEEQELAGHTFRLGKKREGIIADIAMVLGQDMENLTISKLIELLKDAPEDQRDLQSIQAEITAVIEELKMVNEQNKQLIQQSLEFIDFTMNAIQSSRSAPMSHSYPNRTHSPSQQGKNFFDRKQ